MWLNSANTLELKKFNLRHFIYIAAMIWRGKKEQRYTNNQSLNQSFCLTLMPILFIVCTLNIPFNLFT